MPPFLDCRLKIIRQLHRMSTYQIISLTTIKIVPGLTKSNGKDIKLKYNFLCMKQEEFNCWLRVIILFDSHSHRDVCHDAHDFLSAFCFINNKNIYVNIIWRHVPIVPYVGRCACIRIMFFTRRLPRTIRIMLFYFYGPFGLSRYSSVSSSRFVPLL